MKVSDLLDQIVRTSDDDSDEYRNSARRWLNLARSEIADRRRWRDAIRIDTFTTSAAVTTGLYVLNGYEHLKHDWLFDETNDEVIQHEAFATLSALDPVKDTTGPPTWWGDAGTNDNDESQIYLWPVPDGSYVIQFMGYKILGDLTADDDDLEVDPFFGKITTWAPTLAAGMRFYHDLDNNEDFNQVIASQRLFDRLIRRRASVDVTAPTSSMTLANVRNPLGVPATGRFDPAHFNNR